MNAKRLLGSVGGVILLLSLGVAVQAWAGISRGSVRANVPNVPNVPNAPNAPYVTPTPNLPDLTADLSWISFYPCPAPILRVSTQGAGSTCANSTMRLTNNAGDVLDFLVTKNGVVECQVGYCIPYGWLDSLPYTLTVDVNNTIQESNETNNTVTFSGTPPTPTACVSVTATPTQRPTSTPTRTGTPAFPNLTGSLTWGVNPCPAPVLELRTRMIGGTCASAGPSTMRLRNNINQSMDFPVSGLTIASPIYEYDCEVGPCLPAAWLTSMPFTLTVDVFNTVNEFFGEGDNNSVFNTAPPTCPSTSTPTSTPIDTYTPTPTPPPPTATETPTPIPVLVGHVTWQGPPAQPNVGQQLPVTLTLKSGATEVNYPSQNTDSSGFFTASISGLPGGVYAWRVKGPKYLANSGSVPLAGLNVQAVSVEMGLMRVGDADNNNAVNINDSNILRATFGKSLGDPGYDARADFNNDNVVGLPDFNLLRGNFGLGGAPPIGPR